MKLFDAHFHIIDDKFPLQENNGYLPSIFTINDYKKSLSSYGIESVGGTIVSGSFQGYDQSYLTYALNKLRKENYVGVTQLPISVSEREIKELDKQGVKAIRFNIFRGGSEDIKYLSKLANKVYNTAGWSTELYIDTSKITPEQEEIIISLPRVSIDHLGMSSKGKDKLLELVKHGVMVKVTGFGRIDFEPIHLIKEIYSINPNALIFGTDLPSTRAKKPFSYNDIKLITDNFSSKVFNKILFDNAQNWYINYFL